jgi:hypothetical protein
LAQTKTTALVKIKTLEIIRLVIPAGKDIPAARLANNAGGCRSLHSAGK